MSSVIRSDESVSIQRLNIALSSQVNLLHLSNVTLQGNADDLYELSRVIRGHPYLNDITLVNVRLEKPKLNLDGFVCTIFATVQNLEKIHLENIHVSANALASVSHTHSKKLTTYNVPNNGLDDNTAVAVVCAIVKSTTIANVDLSRNQLSEKGVSTIASALEQHPTIVNFSLDGTGDVVVKPPARDSDAKRAGKSAQAA
jgi:hypothetical protein